MMPHSDVVHIKVVHGNCQLKLPRRNLARLHADGVHVLHRAAHQIENDIKVVDHQVEHDADLGAARAQPGARRRVRSQPVRFDEPRLARGVVQALEDGIEALDVPHLQHDVPPACELDELASFLDAFVDLLAPEGRVAVITFHSVEDRRVKAFGRARARDYAFNGGMDVPELREPRVPELRWVHSKAIRPGATELAENPRSRSAQMRVMEKCEKV